MGSDLAASDRLTPLQAAFVRYATDLGDTTKAVTLAGYTSIAPASIAAELLRTPHVVAALQMSVRRKLVTGAPLALRIITEIAKNELVSPKVRLDAAKTLLDRAGHVAPRATAPDNATETPLHEMTVDQLKDLAGRLEGELAGRAKVVNSVNSSASDTQAIDLVG